ncbi:MAG: hypothetical protein OEM64_05295 [Gammaproteobacteria bacterium]|nr:hypothetical protein [Gammaproteobacteria bacterium]MDH3415710.1 hypothetical protein [Gammaproteobacteria bacterium]
MTKLPLIIYVPGLLPKPEHGPHRDALFRCLIAGIRRLDEKVALDIAANLHCFDVVSWTYDFYRTHRDFAIDAASIDALIAQDRATDADIAEASSWKRRLVRRVFSLGDFMPFLIPHIATERMELHLRDLRRYIRNNNGIAEHTRQMLKVPLRTAFEAQRPILLIAHSMGSVIAYDSLWQMAHSHDDRVRIDQLLTMGSPLGQNYIQRRLQGKGETGERRYPNNIRRWVNLTSVGDLTAINPNLAHDFGEMLELGLVDSIEDAELHNYFRLDGDLNVHAEYGYLANDVTAKVVTEWWRSCGRP